MSYLMLLFAVTLQKGRSALGEADVISIKAEDVQWNIARTFLSLHHQLAILFSTAIHSI